MHATMDDWQLADAWKAGDRAAGDLLFDRHFAFLKRFFGSKWNDRSEVADLIADTMLAWMRNPPTPRAGTPFRSLLAGVAMNVLRRRIRMEFKRRRELGDFAAICHESRSMEVSLASRFSPDRRIMVQALRQLPREQQEVIALTYLDELNGHEIARLLDVPVPTVYTRLRRGKQRLRAVLAELESSPRADLMISSLRSWAAGVVS